MQETDCKQPRTEPQHSYEASVTVARPLAIEEPTAPLLNSRFVQVAVLVAPGWRA